jgi:hypothetical protein
MNNEYWTMKEIAALYQGCTSHKVGKELKELGYRTPDGRPSQRAFGEGIVQQRHDSNRPEFYVWAWNSAKVCDLLESFGWQRKMANDATAI